MDAVRKDEGKIPRLHGIAPPVLMQHGGALKQDDDLSFPVQMGGKTDFLVVQNLRPVMILIKIGHGASQER